jgi:hypothetical protein
VSDWLHSDQEEVKYWKDKARLAKQVAKGSRDVIEKRCTEDEAAALELSKLLRNELRLAISSKSKGIQRDLLYKMTSQVNWLEIAEDFVAK